jgi:hypothetical protein
MQLRAQQVRNQEGTPRGKQVIMEEAEFRAHATELALKLATPEVRGVYEERLPLAFDASLALGCVAALVPSARSKPLSEGFDWTDFQARLRSFNACINA